MPAQETIGYWNYMNPAMKALVSWLILSWAVSVSNYCLSGWLVQHLQKQSEISHWGPHPTREHSKLTSTASPETTRDQPVKAIFGTPNITFDNPNISKQITEKFPQHFEGNMTISTVITCESYSQSVRPSHMSWIAVTSCHDYPPTLSAHDSRCI
jgi:hypothetical protein